MRRLARLCIRGSWVIIALTLVASGLSAWRLGDLTYSDDIVGFLPDGDPAVTRFWDIGKRFGGLNLALVGVESADLFTAERLTFLRKLTDELKQVRGVQSVTSITNVLDFAEYKADSGEQQSVVGPLIDEVPTAPEALAGLRGKVLSKDHIAGSLVSRDGGAALVLARLSDDESALETASRIRALAESLQPERVGVQLRMGGSPFISEAMARASEQDLTRLAPFVVGSILLIALASFSSIVGVLLSLVSVLLAILWTAALMAALGRPVTLVSSSFPIVMVALGSAYTVHVLSRYLRVTDAGLPPAQRLEEALAQVGVPVLLAGLTTIAGFFSFLVMDISKMREFGLFLAIGIGFALFLGLVFVPAVLARIPLRVATRKRGGDRLGNLVVAAVERLRPHGKALLVGMALVTVGVSAFVPLVRSDMSMRSYFNEKSEAVAADQFFVDRFGGSMFLQLEVAGDIREPAVLDEIERLSVYASQLAGVTQVQSITDMVRLAHQGLWGTDRMPDKVEQVASLRTMALRDDPSVSLLVDNDWRHTLLQIRLGGFDTAAADRITQQLEAYAAQTLVAKVAAVRWRGPGAVARTSPAAALVFARAAERLTWTLYGPAAPAEKARALATALATAFTPAGAGPADEALERDVRSRLHADFIEDEYIYLADGERSLDALVPAVVAHIRAGTLTEDVLYREVLARADAEERATEEAAAKKGGEAAQQSGFRRSLRKVYDGLAGVETAAIRQALQLAVGRACGPELLAKADRVTQRQVGRILDGLLSEHAYLAAAAAPAGTTLTTKADVSLAVSGYPVLLTGMNRSVQENQVKSSVVAAALLIVLLWLAFRSLGVTLAALAPSAFTLLSLYGILGALDVPMDLGTTMLSSICLGVGIDYPIHLIWGLRRRRGSPADQAMAATLAETGPSIGINALEVTVGFGFLAFATLAPISRIGWLIALAMVLSAGASLFVLPFLLERTGAIKAVLGGTSEGKAGGEPPSDETPKGDAAGGAPPALSLHPDVVDAAARAGQHTRAGAP